MRVLVTLLPSLSHVHTAIPLALELQTRGHDVRIATSTALTPDIESWGVPCYLVGGHWEASQVEVRFPGFLRANPGAQVRTLAGLSEEVSGELIAICETWRPDVVVRDSYDVSGLLAARRCDVPLVVLGIGFRPPQTWLESALRRVVRKLAGAWDVDVPDVSAALGGDLWLSHYPPALAGGQQDLASERHVRPGTFSGPAGNDGPALTDADVYVTLGTVLNKDIGLLRTLVGALADQGLRVIATTGRDVDPAALGELAPHVQVHRYLPQADVLPRVRAVLSHGGFNTVLPALAAGRPVCTVPLSMDHPVTAARCRNAGVGTVVATGTTAAGFPLADPAAIDGQQVLDGVLPLLEDPSYEQRTTSLAAEIRALPDAAGAADLVEDVVL